VKGFSEWVYSWYFGFAVLNPTQDITDSRLLKFSKKLKFGGLYCTGTCQDIFLKYFSCAFLALSKLLLFWAGQKIIYMACLTWWERIEREYMKCRWMSKVLYKIVHSRDLFTVKYHSDNSPHSKEGFRH
jgi:hypothetical protein